MPKKSLKSLADSAASARAGAPNDDWNRLMHEHKEGIAEAIRRQLDALSEYMDSPEMKARDRLEDGLRKLMVDPAIQQSQTCVDLIRALVHCLTYGWTKTGSAELLRPIGDEYKLLQSKAALETQHAKRRAAMAFVRIEWATHRGVYEGNKSEFARIYVRRVLNEFAVKITEKQMREVWLKNTPGASTPACERATG